MSKYTMEIARQRIKDNIAAYKQGNESALELNLAELNIKDIEQDIPELKECIWLQQLNLSDNKIREIKNLEFLINLERLYLSRNQIREIKNIDVLTSLQKLNLSYNQIREIKNIETLINLKWLKFDGNQINEIKNIETLINLKWLKLGSNQIREIKNIETLNNLQELNLGNNQIREIKNLEPLNNLRELNLRNNQIREIKNLETLNNLNRLDLRKNQIKEIKNIESLNNLQWLDLRKNQITSLHSLISYLKNSLLKLILADDWTYSGITIYGNPIINPPLEIVTQGKDAIIHYFEELERSGSEKFYEAKVLVLGEGGAGKTTLIRKLTKGIKAEMPSEEERTQGIDITPLPFEQEGNKHTVHLWDFGGQEIYHATHQFFLTHRSVYVLVTDSRKDDTDFHYWLQVIELLGGKSPIVIIGNRKDDTYKPLPEGELRGLYANIKAFYYLNLKNDKESLAKLLKAVQYEVSSLPQMGEEVPKPMVQVRDRLNVLREEGRKHISLYEFYAICKAEGLEQDRADYYSQLLHDLGLLLHFQKDVVLKHTVFLDNEWITDAVYAVLDDEQIKVKQKGCFSEADAKGLWQASYAPMWQELLALMGKFELCYELPNKKGHYIAPQLLDVERTAAAAAWQLSDSLQLRYQYEFMPKGMVSRLIVRLHRYIADVQESAWKTGAILKDKATGAELLMYEVYGKKEIYLSAKGVFAKDLLSVVSAEVDELNGTYENIKVKKLVPCVCRECKDSAEPHFYDYKNLIERKQKGVLTSECQKSFINVSVEELLDAVPPPPPPPPPPSESGKNQSKPSVLMTFAANDLSDVDTEAEKIWTSVSGNNSISAQKIEDVDINALADAVINSKDLWFFHFGGHASGGKIVLDGFRDLDRNRLANLLLPKSHKMQVVFLNGCLSQGQVGVLTARGVKAVIATNTKVNDNEAVRLANFFYKCFFDRGYTLKAAFEFAEATIQGANAFVMVVNPGEVDEKHLQASPWTLFINDNYKDVLDWTVTDFVKAACS